MTVATEITIEAIKVIGAIVTTVAVPYIAFRQRQLEKNTNSVVGRLVEKTEKLSEAIGKSKEQAAQAGRDEVQKEMDCADCPPIPPETVK